MTKLSPILLERDHSSDDSELYELEPYWDYEHAPKACDAEAEMNPEVRENLAVWLAILLTVTAAAAIGYYMWLWL